MKKFLVVLVLLVGIGTTSGCSTGIGRATSLAVSGIPPSIPQGIDAVETEYDRLANQELADIVAGNVNDDAGNVVAEAVMRQEALKSDREARVDSIHSLLASLREWIGIEKGAAPGETVEKAAALRAAGAKAVLDRLAAESLKAKAKRQDAMDTTPIEVK